MIRFDRSILACAGLVLLLLPTACGGGGGSSGGSSSGSGSSGSGGSGGSILPPSATPTPVSGTSGSSTSLADCTRSSSTQAANRKTLAIPAAAVTAVPTTTYSLTSYPSGAAVSNNGASIGVAPQSFTPQYASTANFIAFTSGTSSYSLCVVPGGFPSHTILFNASGDTSGSITSIATSSVGRSTLASSEQTANVVTGVQTHSLRHARTSDVNANELLVKYHSSTLQTSNRSVESIEKSAGIASARTLGPQSGATISRVVRVPQGVTVQSLTQSLSKDPAVASVSTVHYRSTLSVTPVNPNDPEFTVDQNHQWDLYQIQAPNAWAISEGSPSISIAVIDTGYDPNNIDLNGKVTYAESDVNGTTTVGSTAVQDTDGHGTNVSGIAAANTNNAISVSGTGFNVSLQEYRIFPNPSDPGYSSSSGASSTDEAQAIYDAVANGAKVISLSIGGVDSGGIDQSEYDAVEYAISKGISVVSAAGNERLSGVNTVDFPAAYPGVIAVGASALNDSASPNNRASAVEYVAPYSNSGPGLALVAPGGDPTNTSDKDYLHWILNLDTTQPASSTRCSSLTNCLALFAGTSQATPHVSGAAALLYSINPNLTPAQVRTILMDNADNINDSRQGAGRLNLYRALASIASGAVAPAAPSYLNFVAFGYTNSGGTKPTIVDTTFPGGVPVNSDGTFRLPDIAPGTGTYKIGIWADTNGNGIVDAGDYFGSASAACQSTAPCTASATGITVHPVVGGFTLP